VSPASHGHHRPCYVSGEITTRADLSRKTLDGLIRSTIEEIGYTAPNIGFAASTCQIQTLPAQSVLRHRHGRGRRRRRAQGMMFRLRLARETSTPDAAAHHLAHRLVENHAKLRRNVN